VGDGRSFVSLTLYGSGRGGKSRQGLKPELFCCDYGTAESRAPSRNCVFPQAVKSGPDTNFMAVIRSCHFHAKIEGVERDTSSPELKPQIIQGRLRFSRSLIVQVYALVLLPLLVRGGLFGYAHRGAGGGGCER